MDSKASVLPTTPQRLTLVLYTLVLHKAANSVKRVLVSEVSKVRVAIENVNLELLTDLILLSEYSSTEIDSGARQVKEGVVVCFQLLIAN